MQRKRSGQGDGGRAGKARALERVGHVETMQGAGIPAGACCATRGMRACLDQRWLISGLARQCPQLAFPGRLFKARQWPMG
jgi:hypothetical protein